MSATITALPTPPSRTSPSTFSARADAFLAALAGFVTEANVLAAEVEAAAAALASPGLSATSTTSLTVGLGTQSLTVEAAKSFVAGMSVKIAYTTSPTTWMHGDVITYDPVSGALVVSITLIAGSGTYAAWTISLSAPLADDPEFDSGTKMYFYQDTAPVDWTIDAAVSDCCLAVKGGSNAFNVTGGNKAGVWAMSAAEMPVHSHANTVSGSGSASGAWAHAGGGSGYGHPLSSEHGSYVFPNDAYPTISVSVSINNVNAGSGATTYRPYSAVGIIAAKD